MDVSRETFPLLIERDRASTDEDFILASWLRSYRYSPVVQEVAKDVYFAGQNPIAKRLLAQSQVKLLVSEEDPETIVAWMIHNQGWIHYIYTKQMFRRLGLAKRLVGDPAKWHGYTHLSLISQKMTLPTAWMYDPYRQWQ